MSKQQEEPEIRYNLKLPKALYDEFEEVCRGLGVTKSSVVKMLLGEWVSGLKNGASRSWVPTRTLPPKAGPR